MSAEGRGRIDGVATCAALSVGGPSPGSRVGGGVNRSWRDTEDLARDVICLRGVVLADAAGHEEAFYEAEKGGNTCPEKNEIENSETIATEIEVMDAEATKQQGEQDADDLILTGALVFGVEPAALLVIHVGGVDGVNRVHIVGPLERLQQDIRERENDSSSWLLSTIKARFVVSVRLIWSQFARVSLVSAFFDNWTA